MTDQIFSEAPSSSLLGSWVSRDRAPGMSSYGWFVSQFYSDECSETYRNCLIQQVKVSCGFFYSVLKRMIKENNGLHLKENQINWFFHLYGYKFSHFDLEMSKIYSWLSALCPRSPPWSSYEKSKPYIHLTCIDRSLYLHNYINCLEHGGGQKSSENRWWLVRKVELNRVKYLTSWKNH